MDIRFLPRHRLSMSCIDFIVDIYLKKVIYDLEEIVAQYIIINAIPGVCFPFSANDFREFLWINNTLILLIRLLNEKPKTLPAGLPLLLYAGTRTNPRPSRARRAPLSSAAAWPQSAQVHMRVATLNFPHLTPKPTDLRVANVRATPGSSETESRPFSLIHSKNKVRWNLAIWYSRKTLHSPMPQRVSTQGLPLNTQINKIYFVYLGINC